LRPKSPGGGGKGGNTSGSTDDSHLICFNCGKTGHRAANCKDAAANAADEVEEGHFATEETEFPCFVFLDTDLGDENPWIVEMNPEVADPPLELPRTRETPMEVPAPREELGRTNRLNRSTGPMRDEFNNMDWGNNIGDRHELNNSSTWGDLIVEVASQDFSGDEVWTSQADMEAAVEWVLEAPWEDLMTQVPPTRTHEELLRGMFIRLVRMSRMQRVTPAELLADGLKAKP
jgi:hypothetical protein